MLTPKPRFGRVGSIRLLAATTALAALFTITSPLFSDPCGMVPPIYTGPGTPIARIGLQQTYVFFDDGIESFVIRPGFQGKVDNFGMLIPFPNAPALRKVPDNVFEQIAAAVDPPEVIIDLFPVFAAEAAMDNMGALGGGGGGLALAKNKVAVLKEEAVGMYEVAVLEAGSAAALKRWMDKNEYQYPKGMDKVTEEYINEGWCFVAVKTKVAEKAAADPRPGQRQMKPEMPKGSVFDGNVQGLGFRFKSEELVVPMRLSAFNDGDTRNVVYLLTKGGKRIRSIPEEYVQRQVPGKQLIENLTKPLNVRIVGEPGRKLVVPEWRKKSLPQDRDPEKHNGVAKQLFVSDILAKQDEDLSLDHEETEKELLRLGEHFGLRGIEIDREIEAVSKELSRVSVSSAVPKLEEFTLTVVDGDFPRKVLANENLRFSDYRIAANRNSREKYDTKQHKPGGKARGKLISHLFDAPNFDPTQKLEFVFEPSDSTEASTDGYVVRRIDTDSLVQDSFTVTKRSMIIAGLLFLLGLLIHQPTREQQDDNGRSNGTASI